jgi:hypothetical protein
MPWKEKPSEIYQTGRDVDYYLFVDESGTHVMSHISNSNPFFTVSAVLLSTGLNHQ